MPQTESMVILGAGGIGVEFAYFYTEMIAELGLAMNLAATYEEIETTIHAHPTLSEAAREAANQGLRPRHSPLA